MLETNKMLAGAILNSYLVQDGRQGCTDDIFNQPVQLVPPFREFVLDNNLNAPPFPPPLPFSLNNRALSFLRLWFHRKETCPWASEAESFLPHMSFMTDLWAYEILGNKNGIIHLLCVRQVHETATATIIKALCSEIEATSCDENILEMYAEKRGLDFRLFDSHPLPPFFRSFRYFDNNDRSSFLSFYETLSMVPSSAIACLQVLIQPVDSSHNWHKKIAQSLVVEQSLSQLANLNDYTCWHMPPVSESSREQFKKSDPSKKLFAFQPRMFLLSKPEDTDELSKCLRASMNALSLNGRQLSVLTEKDYARIAGLSEKQIREMICQCFTYTYGCIVNQTELVGFFHFPTAEVCQSAKRIDRLDGWKVPEDLQKNGPRMGTISYAGKEYVLRFNQEFRNMHLEVVGTIRRGKTTLLGSMIIDDIESGKGVGLIYPHEKEMVDEILEHIPKNRIDDVIYIHPCMKGFVIAYNHFHDSHITDFGKKSDDFTQNIRALYSQHWGPNMEHIFRHLFFALGALPEANLYDAPLLLDTSNREGDLLRRKLIKILERLENPEPLRFWTVDLPKYRVDLKPIFNKLSAIFLNLFIAKTFAYRGKSKFSLRKAMDEQKIVIIYEPAGILGDAGDFDSSLYISDFFHAAMSRTNASKITPFYLYIDELHRYTTRSIGDILRECSKFGLYLTISNQQRIQLNQQTRNEIGNIGNFIAFQPNFEDAKALERETAERISANDLLTLGKYNFIASIGEHLVRGRTMLQEKPEKSYVTEIIERCLSNYYVPESDISFRMSEKGDGPLSESKKTRKYDTL